MTQGNEPRRRSRVVRVGILVVVVALVGAGVWWFMGRKVWTDDRAVRELDGQARLREVVWEPPKAMGELFGSDARQHYEPSFSPDGTELYFVTGKPGQNADIYVSYRKSNHWTQPEPVTAINTPYDELGPRVTPDGKYLLFYSNRPGGYGGYDIWAAPRTTDGWGQPFNLGPNINSEFNEFTPDATPDGRHLIFATNRTAARREQMQPWSATIRESSSADYDLWIAELSSLEQPTTEPAKPDLVGSASRTVPATQPAMVRGADPTGNAPAAPSPSYAGERVGVRGDPPFAEKTPLTPALSPAYKGEGEITAPTTQSSTVAETLPSELAFGPAHEIPGINTPFVEGASCMSPAGDFLYFASNRPGGFGKFDIWRCRVSPDWKFGPVENAGPQINTADNETDPALAFNGYRMVFSSDRGSDAGVYRLFTSDSREVYAMRDGRPLPQMGRSAWLFIVSLALLIPLLLLLRGWDEGRLGVLQKCLLISLLAHVLLCLALTFMYVSKDAYHYVRQQMGVEVAINLNAPAEVEIETAIRRQSIGDLPTNGAPPSAQRSTQTPLETKIAPGPIEPALPRAAAIPTPTLDFMALDRPQPAIQAAMPAPRPMAPPDDLPKADTVDAHVDAPRALSQAEARPRFDVPSPVLNKTAPELSAARAMAAPAPFVPTAQAPVISPPVEPAVTQHLPTQAMVAAPDVRPVVPSPTSDTPRADITNTVTRLTAADVAPTAKEQVSGTAGPLRSAAPEKGAANVALSNVNVDVPHISTAATIAPIEQAAGAGRASAMNMLVAAPTTMPSSSIAEAIEPAGPKIDAALPGSSAPRRVSDAPVTMAEAVGPSTQPSAPMAVAGFPQNGGPGRLEVHVTTHASGDEAARGFATSIPALGAASRGAAFSSTVAGASVSSPSIPNALDGPRIALPQPAVATLASSRTSTAGAGDRPADAGPSVALSGKQTLHGVEGGGQKNVAIDIPGPIAASAQLPSDRGTGLDPLAARPHVTQIVSAMAPQIDIGPLPTDIGNGRLNAPDAPFKMRNPEVHRPIIEQLGGTRESEDAVARALAWLADNQEENGRWTTVYDSNRRKRPRSEHDTALTALPVLAYLAQDHRPDKPGPYRQTVTRGLDFLLASQRRDGDLRGDMPGPGANQGNMYDHGIASYAMAEAAIATHDPRYVDAALRAADFIVKAQNEETGGWRYSPKEQGDTSVFGWQVMALHSAERVGFMIPDRTREGIDRYIQLATTGRRRMLASYQPHREPTPTMTAQMAFTRMLLGQQLTDREMSEASDFLSHDPPDRNQPDLYYWYYASLCMDQMQTDAWKTWNQKTRDTLIAMQIREGEHDSYWDANVRKGAQAGRVFSTSMAALTLEVYYRYAPMQVK